MQRKGKITLIAGLSVVAVVLVIAGIVLFPVLFDNQTDQAVKTGVPSKPAAWEEVTPGQGKGDPPEFAQPDEDGPWNHRVESASSQDGITFTKDSFVLSDQASVPDAILDKNGRIRVYYVDWKNGGISVAIQQDGSSYKYYKVKISNLKTGKDDSNWVDPDVVVLSNGKYRLYGVTFDQKGGPGDPGQPGPPGDPGGDPGKMESDNQILSAISEDGVNFEVEEGVRFKAAQLTDSDIVKTSDGWHMFFSVGPDLVSLTSKDGLKFTDQSDVLLGGSVGSTLAFDDFYRLYYHMGTQDGLKIFSAVSTDLINWEQEDGVRLEDGGDPSPVRLSDGTYKMFYKTFIEQMAPPPMPPPPID